VTITRLRICKQRSKLGHQGTEPKIKTETLKSYTTTNNMRIEATDASKLRPCLEHLKPDMMLPMMWMVMLIIMAIRFILSVISVPG